LPLLAEHWLTTECDTTHTRCSRWLALGTQRGPLPRPLRLSQEDGVAVADSQRPVIRDLYVQCEKQRELLEVALQLGLE